MAVISKLEGRGKMVTSFSVRILGRVFTTLILVLLSGWLLRHSWQQRHVFHKNYTFTAEEAGTLKYLPEAQYAHGLHAWFRQDPATAARFFRQAVSQNVLFIDAWLKLAQAEASMGHLGIAQTILRFTDKLTAPIFRWKWRQTLLARELGEDALFWRNINFLISHERMSAEALQLMDSNTKGQPASALEGLEPGNLAPYLRWLMRWGRTADTYAVWQKMGPAGSPDLQTLSQYVHFLIDKKWTVEAADIWQAFTGIKGLTNPGFEQEMTGQGFDWRFWNHGGGNWVIRQVDEPTRDGAHALEISFAGKENLSFHHLYQIVPVSSQTPYRLSYWWKSAGITTDQGPFVEIYGHDVKGFYQKGTMITGTKDWHPETIHFVAPEGSEAVVIRLRRLQSRRFDCKIAGRLWLDDFRLEVLDR